MDRSATIYVVDRDGKEEPQEVVAPEGGGIEGVAFSDLALAIPTREPEYYKSWFNFGRTPQFVLVDMERDRTIVELFYDEMRMEWRVVA